MNIEVKTNGNAFVQNLDQLENVYEQLGLVKELNVDLEGILDTSYDGIGVVDSKGILIRINKSYERITGLKMSDILNKSLKELIDQGLIKAAPSLVALKEKRQVTMVQEIRTGVKVLITSTPVYDFNGEIIRVIANIRDLTELDRLRKETLKHRSLSQQYHSELTVLKTQQLLPEDIVARSEKMSRIVDMAVKVAQTDTNVLIEGESGVGKEVVAKLIHNSSNRRTEPYIKINCAAIPDQLLESELFGYSSGAFTGAQKGGKLGLLELANNGTILMDEIGELPLSLQAKLLRALEEQIVYRLGSTKPVKLNIRIIAATNRSLQDMVYRNEFRQDLYYRLRVFPITVPPLRERLEDIAPLVNLYLKKINDKLNTRIRLSINAFKLLEKYEWPGNVRQLQNVLEGSVIFSDSDVIKEGEIEALLDTLQFSNGENVSMPATKLTLDKDLLATVLKQSRSVREAARRLGVSHPTVIKKMKKYGLVKVDRHNIEKPPEQLLDV